MLLAFIDCDMLQEEFLRKADMQQSQLGQVKVVIKDVNNIALHGMYTS